MVNIDRSQLNPFIHDLKHIEGIVIVEVDFMNAFELLF